MSDKNSVKQKTLFGKGLLCLLLSLLSACYSPPYNNFRPYSPVLLTTTSGALVSAAAVAIAGGPVPLAAAVGAGAGAVIGLSKNTKLGIIHDLQKHTIQYVEYGDTITLIVPTDRYFLFNSPHLNELCYPGLSNIVKLIKLFPPSPIYIAGFTDEISSTHNKKMLSQAQAESMLTYLWASGIPSECLHAEGYGDKHPVADNRIIHGSAENRRVEIQWFKTGRRGVP